MMVIFILFALLALTKPAEAITRYADSSLGVTSCGNYNPDTRLCSGGNATAYGGTNGLRNAKSGLGAGDIVEVRDGTYAGAGGDFEGGTQFPSGSAISFLTIRGYQLERPVVRGFNFNGVTQPSRFITIQNLVINCNGGFDTIGAISVHYQTWSGVEVTNCGGGGLSGFGDVTFTNLDVWNNGFNCSAPRGQCHGAYSGNPGSSGYPAFITHQNIIIDGGRYHHNRDIGLQCYTLCGGSTIRNARFDHNGTHGAVIGADSGIIVHGNIFDNNTNFGLFIFSPNAVISNITSVGNLSGGVCIDRAGMTIRNSLVVGNTGSGQIATNCNSGTFSFTQQTNITTGSLAAHFVNAGAGDFRLAFGSIAIGAGTNLSLSFTTDYAGNSWPSAGAWDVGAIRFGSAAIATQVVITSPTANPTYLTTTSPITTIAGTASSGVSLTSVTWANSLGGSGTATGLGNWFIPSVTLSAGVNVITVTVTDSAGNTGQDTLSITYTAVAQQLVAAWSCNEGAGTTVGDSSGNTNTGTFTGAAWTAGRFGSACSFDGSTSLITVADSASLDLTSGITIGAWLYSTNTANLWRSLLGKGENYYLFTSSSDQCAPSAPTGGYFAAAAYNNVCSSTIPAINTWTYIAMTFDGSAVQLYTGTTPGTLTLRSTLLSSLAMTPNADSLLIGKTTATSGEAFVGYMDEIRIYNYGRSATAGSGSCGSDPTTGIVYSQIQCDMITPIIQGASIIIQLNVTALQLGPGIVLEMGSAP